MFFNNLIWGGGLFLQKIIHSPFLPNYFELWSAVSDLFEDSVAAVSQAPLVAIFLMHQLCLAIFVQGHLVSISAKLISSLTIGYLKFLIL